MTLTRSLSEPITSPMPRAATKTEIHSSGRNTTISCATTADLERADDDDECEQRQPGPGGQSRALSEDIGVGLLDATSPGVDADDLDEVLERADHQPHAEGCDEDRDPFERQEHDDQLRDDG